MTNPRELATRLLKTALPSALQTTALNVCVHADAEAFEDWRRRIGTTGTTRQVLGRRTSGLRRLLPLLYFRFRQSSVEVDKSLTTYLRTAAAREKLRTESVRGIVENALMHLCRAGLSPIVLKGMAVAETVYPEPWTRHCHDLDLLLPSAEMGAAAAALASAGYRHSQSRPGALATSVWLTHSSAFQIGLHQSLYRVTAWNTDIDLVIDASVPASIAGSNVRILSPPDALAHICCNGLSAGSMHSPCWAADSSFVIQAAGEGFDWRGLVTVARMSNYHPVVGIALNYLVRELRAPIPESVVKELLSIPAQESEVESVLDSALLSVRGSSLGLIRRANNPRDMARTAWWLVGRTRGNQRDQVDAQRA